MDERPTGKTYVGSDELYGRSTSTTARRPPSARAVSSTSAAPSWHLVASRLKKACSLRLMWFWPQNTIPKTRKQDIPCSPSPSSSRKTPGLVPTPRYWRESPSARTPLWPPVPWWERMSPTTPLWAASLPR